MSDGGANAAVTDVERKGPGEKPSRPAPDKSRSPGEKADSEKTGGSVKDPEAKKSDTKAKAAGVKSSAASEKKASEKKAPELKSTPVPDRRVVVPLPVRAVKREAQRVASVWADRWLPLSAALVILLPTLLVALYLAVVASNRYAVEVRFAVRGQEVAMMDAAGMFGALGGAPSQTASDSFIVADYLVSRQLVEELDARVDLRAMYTKPGIDILSRLSPEASIERLVEYWRAMTRVYFDSTKGTISLEVSAFRPQDATRIAEESVALARLLVNRLSEESRADALRGALADVERAEFRVRMMREAMQQFREEQRIADPVTSAGTAQSRIASLQAEISAIDTQLGSALAFMSEEAPSVVVMRAQRAALEQQLARARADIDGSAQAQGGGAVATMLSTFEELEIERQFAQQAYTAALASLERARGEADRTQRYLAVFADPRTPQEALYPRVLRSILTVFAFAGLAWVLGVLLFYGVREHTS